MEKIGAGLKTGEKTVGDLTNKVCGDPGAWLSRAKCAESGDAASNTTGRHAV